MVELEVNRVEGQGDLPCKAVFSLKCGCGTHGMESAQCVDVIHLVDSWPKAGLTLDLGRKGCCQAYTPPLP